MENPPLQFFLAGNVSVEIMFHLIKTAFLLLEELSRLEERKYSLPEHAVAAEKYLPFLLTFAMSNELRVPSSSYVW
jgi:hypothetical protein